MIKTKPVLPKNALAKMVRYGDSLAKQLFTRKFNTGGVQVLLIGIPGTGKTTLLLRFLQKIWNENKEYCIWKGRQNECIHYIEGWKKKTKLFYYSKDKIKVLKLDENGSNDITNELNIVSYNSPEDLLQKIDNKYINVVYPPSSYVISEQLLELLVSNFDMDVSDKELTGTNKNYFWHEFFYTLTSRKDTRWISLFFDELDDNFGSIVCGLEYWLVRFFKDRFKDFRKTNVSFFGAVHYVSDLNYMILSKFQTFIYLRGAKIPKGRMVNSTLPLQLNQGEYIIDNSNFGLCRFSPLAEPDYKLLVEITPIKQTKPTKKKMSYKAKLLRVVNEQGIGAAYDTLETWKENREISGRYYNKLKLVLDNLEI